MSALVAFARTFLEERLASCAPERIHQFEGISPKDTWGCSGNMRAAASFARPLESNSGDFDIVDIIERGRGRGRPVEPGEEVPRLLQEIDLSDARPVTIAPGELILFSSQHAHVGIPNHTDLTRISLETRTLRLADLEAGRGAPNVDGRARWISYGMFRRIADARTLPDVLGVSPFVPFRRCDAKIDVNELQQSGQ